MKRIINYDRKEKKEVSETVRDVRPEKEFFVIEKGNKKLLKIKRKRNLLC